MIRVLPVAAFLVTAATPVFATKYIITYKGIVAPGAQNTNVFGSGIDIGGLSYMAVYTLDTGVGATATDSGVVADITGSGVNSPLKATLTINNITVSFGFHALTTSDASQTNAAYDATNHFVQDFDNGNYFYFLYNSITNHTADMVTTDDYTHPLSYTLTANDDYNGNFGVSTGNGRSYFALGNLRPQTITIEGVSATVPEASTWAMMIGGLGLIGSAMRRRKQQTTIRFA